MRAVRSFAGWSTGFVFLFAVGACSSGSAAPEDVPGGSQALSAAAAPAAGSTVAAAPTAGSTIAAAPACTTPVACAGTASGSWCVDTFFAGDTTFPQFTGLWSAGPNDVWAVGSRNDGDQQDANGFAFHWDGCTWSQAPIATKAGLNDVWGAGPNDVWIVGAQGAAFHWDGNVWAQVTTGATGAFNHVSGTSGTDVWAVGNAGLYHWNGSAWAADPRLSINSENGFLGDIWAVAPDDVWVAEGLNARGSVAHYDGTNWTVAQVSPEAQFGLFGVWASAHSTWAVGAGNQVMRAQDSTWSQLNPPHGSAQGWVNAIGTDTEVWASGQTVARAGADGAFQRIADVAAGFYPGLWLNEGQVWVAGIANTGAAVVLHRPR